MAFIQCCFLNYSLFGRIIDYVHGWKLFIFAILSILTNGVEVLKATCEARLDDFISKFCEMVCRAEGVGRYEIPRFRRGGRLSVGYRSEEISTVVFKSNGCFSMVDEEKRMQKQECHKQRAPSLVPMQKAVAVNMNCHKLKMKPWMRLCRDRNCISYAQVCQGP